MKTLMESCSLNQYAQEKQLYTKYGVSSFGTFEPKLLYQKIARKPSAVPSREPVTDAPRLSDKAQLELE